VEWLAPVVLIPATIVVVFLCTRAAVRAIRAERAQEEDPGSAPEERDHTGPQAPARGSNGKS